MSRTRGRPATGKMPKMNLRVTPEFLENIGGFIGRLGCKTRSDVIRKMVSLGYPLFKTKCRGKITRTEIAALKQSYNQENDYDEA